MKNGLENILVILPAQTLQLVMVVTQTPNLSTLFSQEFRQQIFYPDLFLR